MTIVLIDGVGRSQTREVPEPFGDVYRLPICQPLSAWFEPDVLNLPRPDIDVAIFRHTGEFLLRGRDGLAILPIYRLTRPAHA